MKHSVVIGRFSNVPLGKLVSMFVIATAVRRSGIADFYAHILWQVSALILSAGAGDALSIPVTMSLTLRFPQFRV